MKVFKQLVITFFILVVRVLLIHFLNEIDIFSLFQYSFFKVEQNINIDYSCKINIIIRSIRNLTN